MSKKIRLTFSHLDVFTTEDIIKDIKHYIHWKWGWDDTEDIIEVGEKSEIVWRRI